MRVKHPTAGILLAAGMSRRFGKPKQLLPFQGNCMLAHVLETALASRLDTVVLVLGHEASEISGALGPTLKHPRVKVVVNPRYRKGLSTSLHTGLQEVRHFPSVMFLLGDQPWMNTRVINMLLDRFQASEKPICVPVHAGKRGTPVLFTRTFYDRLMKIKGDMGAREIIASHREGVLQVEVPDPGVFADVDTPADLDPPGQGPVSGCR